MRVTPTRCHHENLAPILVLVAMVALMDWGWTTTRRTAEGSRTVPRCDPSRHICEGRCPVPPPGTEPTMDPERGVCLGDSQTGACVCWLPTSPAERLHLQTLFKCEEAMPNGTVRHAMCLPPAVCFPPDTGAGCMIVPHCPCTGRPQKGIRWHPVAALILRSSSTPVEEEAASPTDEEKGEEAEAREFAPRHLLFLLAFVVAPLLCWCLLTFFNGSRCRLGKIRRGESTEAEEQPLPTDRMRRANREEEGAALCRGAPVTPSAPPKPMDSPPPYEAPTDPHASDCGPPPSYEDAVRDPRWPVTEEEEV